MVRSPGPRFSSGLVARFASVNCFSMNTTSCFISISSFRQASIIREESGPIPKLETASAWFADWGELTHAEPNSEAFSA
jgi:hypothetical protein